MTTNIENQRTWYTLREFETREITSRRYATWHEKELNTAKAKAIVSNFIQAREYYQNASVADFTVRPLLQYYGVSSLSRGLALFLKADDGDTLEARHGLSTCSWNKTLSDDHPDFGQLAIKLTGKGVFHELLVSTKGKCYLRVRSSAVDLSVTDAPNPGSKFTFKDIASRIPDISDQYAAWTGSPPQPLISLETFQRHPDNQNRNKYKLTAGKSDPVDLGAIFPSEKCPNLKKRQDGTTIFVEYDGSFVPFLSQVTNEQFLSIGSVALYSPLDSDESFTPLAACFMLSYILGMLCRYHPAVWTGLVRFETKDAIYPLIARILDWIQDMFPAMVVDILQGPYDFENSPNKRDK